jgi:hypothetical protein
MVEMYSKYHPVVPVEFHSDELYAEPSSKVYAKVARLKETKYKNDTEKIEKMAFDSCKGKA